MLGRRLLFAFGPGVVDDFRLRRVGPCSLRRGRASASSTGWMTFDSTSCGSSVGSRDSSGAVCGAAKLRGGNGRWKSRGGDGRRGWASLADGCSEDDCSGIVAGPFIDRSGCVSAGIAASGRRWRSTGRACGRASGLPWDVSGDGLRLSNAVWRAAHLHATRPAALRCRWSDEPVLAARAPARRASEQSWLLPGGGQDARPRPEPPASGGPAGPDEERSDGNKSAGEAAPSEMAMAAAAIARGYWRRRRLQTRRQGSQPIVDRSAASRRRARQHARFAMRSVQRPSPGSRTSPQVSFAEGLLQTLTKLDASYTLSTGFGSTRRYGSFPSLSFKICSARRLVRPIQSACLPANLT